MTTTTILHTGPHAGPHTGLTLLPTERTTPPDRSTRPIGLVRHVGSIVGRALRTLSVRNATPSEQAMRGISSIDRPMR
ncbi:MAG: hypothetical protein AAGD33_03860 [Actinomycetota bacterium]